MKPIRLSSPYNRRKEHDELVKAALEVIQWQHWPDVHCWPNKTEASYNPATGGYVRGRTYKGPADIICVVRGFHVELEAKTGKAVMSKDQREHAIQVERAGGEHHVFRDLMEALHIIENMRSRVIYTTDHLKDLEKG